MRPQPTDGLGWAHDTESTEQTALRQYWSASRILILMNAFSRHLRTALIRHEPDPDGPPPHFDWMVEPGLDSIPGSMITSETRDVLTWRTAKRPDQLGIGDFVDLEPIPPHRRIWLERAPGLRFELRPPMGTATILRRGRVPGPLPNSGEFLKFDVVWSESDDVHHLRIENRGPRGARLFRLPVDRDAPNRDGVSPC